MRSNKIGTFIWILFMWGTMMSLYVIDQASKGNFSLFYVIPAAAVCGAFGGLVQLLMDEKDKIEKLREELEQHLKDQTS